MICAEARELISAYQDGELSQERRDEVGRHLQECRTCAALLQRNLKLSAAIRETVPAFAPPDHLLERVDKIGAQPQPWRPFAYGLAVGLAACIAVFFAMRSGGADFSQALVSDHIRSTMANHLIDVPSSDRHTVKPWFTGRIDFSPTVPDLASRGFPLVGGRIEYVDGHTAAALVYKKALHVINVIVMPEREGGTSKPEMDGYNIRHWQIGDLGYWAVSDVTGDDLDVFAKAFVEAR